MRPILKWAGGKYDLYPQLAPFLPQAKGYKPKAYFEPFCGACGMYLAQVENGIEYKEINLSDLNSRLIHTLKMAAIYPQDIRDIANHIPVDEENYYRIRDLVNAAKVEDHNIKPPFNLEQRMALAAYVLYLNKTCFNGLWRENASGAFNVPFGHKSEDLVVTSLKDLEEWSAITWRSNKAKPNVSLICRGYALAIASAIKQKKDSFIYADPPYHGGFVSYLSGGFSEAEQVNLRNRLLEARDAGCLVIISNSNNEFIRTLYESWNIHEIYRSGRMSADGNDRSNISELVITSY